MRTFTFHAEADQKAISKSIIDFYQIAIDPQPTLNHPRKLRFLAHSREDAIGFLMDLCKSDRPTAELILELSAKHIVEALVIADEIST